MQALVHITAPVEEDLRSRRLARAIGEYMQDTGAHPGPEGEADTTGEELYPEEDPPQAETGTHPETHTRTQTDTDGETEAHTGTQTETVTEAHPPPLQPSSTPFTSHITPTLSMLASRLPLHRFYRPAWQTRPLSVWERGYWLVSGPSVSGPSVSGPSGSSTGTDISTDTGIGTRASTGTGTGTETEGTARLWPFISQIIQQEKAGWGVWAVKRSPASSAVPNSTDHNQTQTHRQAQVQTQTQVQVQVYCWGQVVPYIYLLFLVGSNRRLTGYSLQWRDAADHIVVQM